MKKNNYLNKVKLKRGFALSLEALLFVAIFAAASLKFSEMLAQKSENTRISATAEEINKVTNGVRRLISDFHDKADALESMDATAFAGIGSTGGTVTFNDLNFLKSTACGAGLVSLTPVVIPSNPTKTVDVPTTGYIDCAASDINSFSQSYTITLTNSGTGFTSTIRLSPLSFPDKPEKSGFIAEKIAISANSSSGSLSIPSGNSQWRVVANPGLDLESASFATVVASPDFGAIEVNASTSGNIDQWLELDGTSVMRGNIDAGDNSLFNVATISGSGGALEVTANTKFSGLSGIVVDNSIFASDILLTDGTNSTQITGSKIDTTDVNATNISATEITTDDIVLNNFQIGGGSLTASQGYSFTNIADTSVSAVNINKPTCPNGTPHIFAIPANGVQSAAGVYGGTRVKITDNAPAATWSIRVMELINDAEVVVTNANKALAQYTLKCF